MRFAGPTTLARPSDAKVETTSKLWCCKYSVSTNSIQVRGAREHNLKDVSVDIPKNKFVVITGPSGSGKSTLAFDTIFAEGQRRYIESLSAYAKQFVEQLKKPEVESIKGLCPSIAIQQKALSKNPRSTVGTLTEIYDYLRLLFSRVGTPHCPRCDNEISSQSSSQIVDQIFELPVETRLNVMAIIARKKKGEFQHELDELLRQGIVRVRIDGSDISLEKGLKLEKNKPHTIEAYIDRLILKENARHRLDDAVELASSIAGGQIQIEDLDSKKTHLYSQQLSCSDCGYSFSEITPRLFSFNSPIGACEKCRGTGMLRDEEEETDESEGGEEDNDGTNLKAIADEPCPECLGSRLKLESRSVRVSNHSIVQIHEMPVRRALEFFLKLKFTGNRAIIADKILHEIRERLGFLSRVGLDYLSLSRKSATLSGGEEQRVRLATQIGTRLTGVLYVLDEPSIGLHQVDNQKLIDSLLELRDHGNSVLVVEHDLDTMLAADEVIDLGPGAGRHGGVLVDQAAPKKMSKGLTAEFLNGKRKINVPDRRRPDVGQGRNVSILGAHQHNLKDIDVKIPMGLFTVVTGVSGSGKSTLVMDVLVRSLTTRSPVGCKKIEGLEHVDKIISVDQSAIGRSPRSNPATYIGLFSLIRELYSHAPLSRMKGYTPGRFSFNVSGGRCEVCKGAGELDIEMHFLPDVSVMCETCQGQRYNPETLAVAFKGKNIFECLEMTFAEALDFFEAFPAIQAKVKIMNDVGLGYLKLGQPAVTLSGGEAQRIKLAKEISKRPTGKTIYVLDEPTTGLHFVDIERLLKVVQQLVDLGNTVVMIEHQLDVIKSADHVIDLGPLGGEHGGEIVSSGAPEAVAQSKASKTGFFLKSALRA